MAATHAAAAVSSFESNADGALRVGREHLDGVHLAKLSRLSFDVLLELHPEVRVGEHLLQGEHALQDDRRSLPIAGVVEPAPSPSAFSCLA